MPTYEYACDTCGHHFDIRQSFNDEPIRVCPECGAAVRRVLYPSGVIFKGSGWYVTENRKSSGSGSSSGVSPKTESAPSETPASTESKEPAKTAAKADD
jgi:putative FmdB family regulatory protein